jgi:hypothetical protein
LPFNAFQCPEAPTPERDSHDPFRLPSGTSRSARSRETPAGLSAQDEEDHSPWQE